MIKQAAEQYIEFWILIFAMLGLFIFGALNAKTITEMNEKLTFTLNQAEINAKVNIRQDKEIYNIGILKKETNK